MRPILNALAPQTVVQLAIASAQEIDTEIDALDGGMLAKVEAEGKTVWLDRAHHRLHHLEQIEKAIS
jgi:hypothetical protein